jgi:hypothetical protein
MQEEEYIRMQDEYDYHTREEYDEYEDLLPPGSDFIRDSAEMNAIRPEDLDEQGEGSKVSLVVFIAIFIY